MEWERRRSRWTMELSRHHVLENAAVNSFVEKYNDRITGVISCFDRMLFKGYLPIGWSDAMEVMFRDADALKAPYKELLKHATLCFSAEDVLTILVRSWISKPAQTSWACQHLRLLSVAPNWLGRIFLCVYKSTMCFRPGVSECCVPGRRDLFVCWDDQIARCGRDSSEMTLYHPPSILCMT